MKSHEISQILAEFENQRFDLVAALDVAFEKFRGFLPGIAETWMRREVERRIAGNPDQVQALGLEKVKILKWKINALIDRLPAIASEETRNRKEWPHYRVPDPADDGKLITNNESYFTKAFKSVISHVAAPLDEFGLLSEPKGYYPSWAKISDAKLRYAINPGFVNQANGPVAEYMGLFKKYESLIVKIEITKAELSKAKARELWESA